MKVWILRAYSDKDQKKCGGLLSERSKNKDKKTGVREGDFIEVGAWYVRHVRVFLGAHLVIAILGQHEGLMDSRLFFLWVWP